MAWRRPGAWRDQDRPPQVPGVKGNDPASVAGSFQLCRGGESRYPLPGGTSGPRRPGAGAPARPRR